MAKRLLNPGDVLGSYTIQDDLGEGSLASIYRATTAGGEEVALKVIEAGNPADRARLWEEHQMLSGLAHPSIVRVSEWGEESGWVYYAMEYIKGPTLRFFVLAGRMVYSVSMDLFRQVIEAVAYLHSRGIVHGDISPTKIMIRHRYEGGVALLGFRPARPAGQGLLKEVRGGTLDFISPEHAAFLLGAAHGKEYVVGPRDNVYSLGVLLFYVLTGEWPVKRPEPTQEGHLQFLRRLQRQEPLDPRELAPLAPAHISKLVLKMLETRPDLRPSAAEAAAEMREAYKKDERAVLSPVSMLEVAEFLANQQLLAEEMTDLVQKDTEPSAPPAPELEEEDAENEAQLRVVRQRYVRNLFLVGAVAAVIAVIGTLVAVRGSRSPEPTNESAVTVREDSPPTPWEHETPEEEVPLAEEMATDGSYPWLNQAGTVLDAVPVITGPLTDQVLPPCPDGTVSLRGGCWVQHVLKGEIEVLRRICNNPLEDIVSSYVLSFEDCVKHRRAFSPVMKPKKKEPGNTLEKLEEQKLDGEPGPSK